MAERRFIDSRQEMETILREVGMGFLGLSDPSGVPYVVPLNYGYVDGRILFHCSLKGRKLDCIRAHPAVSFTVARQSRQVQPHYGDPCHIDSDSVICTGHARIVEELPEKAALLNEFNRCFQPDADDLSEARIRGCALVEIRLTEMTGRRELSKATTYWRWRF